MNGVHFLIFCCSVSCVQGQVTLDVDRPWIRVPVGDPVVLECCYHNHRGTVRSTWFRRVKANSSAGFEARSSTSRRVGSWCDKLSLASVQLNHSGLYQCYLNGTKLHLITHGTYLQVYEPLHKTINVSEESKNGILITEGILLLLCVLLPSLVLIYKTKWLNEMEKKKAMSKQENVYQGLNLDDCYSKYDQIQRPKTQGEYEDVDNLGPEEEFEKP